MPPTLVDTLVLKLTALLDQIGATADNHLWLGYSGGMDSELLAYTLARFRETHQYALSNLPGARTPWPQL